MNSWYYHFKQAFSEQECEDVIAHGLTLDVEEATVGSSKIIDKEIRKSSVRWIKRDSLRWLFDRISLMALHANDRSFHLDLSNYPWGDYKTGQFTEYCAEDKQEYKWHTDMNWINPTKVARKVSCVVLLSHEVAFTGGQLELENVELSKDFFSSQGDVIFFPSHLRHRVTEVTRGTRHSLVVWFNGPKLT